MDRIYDKNRKIYQYKVKWLNYPTFEASFTDEQDSFREHIEEYDAKFPRGSSRPRLRRGSRGIRANGSMMLLNLTRLWYLLMS